VTETLFDARHAWGILVNAGAEDTDSNWVSFRQWFDKSFAKGGNERTELERINAPATKELALRLALDWAEGRRSWANLGPHAPYTPDVIAVMDAQEVVKWTALAAVLPEGIPVV
jgi:hypothetical protein